ncbi:ACT domain-containing protein [Marinagarivorans algicola]|uniref:ACT domain-containing protein n=1 Tax=Marinagarivorans algicola TaxID=1513270 RepID=UPI0006B914E9|nr:ACT domain-containing protein [Marinagarivorans algicola]
MAGITALNELLSAMSPKLMRGEFVFCTTPDSPDKYLSLQPVAFFVEQEGLTLILPKDKAMAAGLPFDGVFRQITLMVHSSLEAVGLTAAVATKLADKGISANVVAAHFHDHVFVPSVKAEAALLALREFDCKDTRSK